jgi:hypothetical protein
MQFPATLAYLRLHAPLGKSNSELMGTHMIDAREAGAVDRDSSATFQLAGDINLYN